MGVLAHVVPKTPPRKMCQKPHPEKNRFKPEKSQGQIPRSNPKIKSQGQMPRSNPKVKYFRNAKVKSQGQIPRSNGKPQKKPEKTGFNWKNRKNGKWKNGKV